MADGNHQLIQRRGNIHLRPECLLGPIGHRCSHGKARIPLRIRPVQGNGQQGPILQGLCRNKCHLKAQDTRRKKSQYPRNALPAVCLFHKQIPSSEFVWGDTIVACLCRIVNEHSLVKTVEIPSAAGLSPFPVEWSNNVP